MKMSRKIDQLVEAKAKHSFLDQAASTVVLVRGTPFWRRCVKIAN